MFIVYFVVFVEAGDEHVSVAGESSYPAGRDAITSERHLHGGRGVQHRRRTCTYPWQPARPLVVVVAIVTRLLVVVVTNGYGC